MKRRHLIPLMTLAGMIITFFSLRTPDTDPVQMLDKYGGPQATFAGGPGSMKIHFRDQGNPNGQPIILIHGLTSSLHTWEPLVQRLGGEFRIITYDQPGHGLTGEAPDNDYSPSGLMRALDAVADASGIEHFILGGNSMGGRVAWHYALVHPERVDALVLIDAAGAPLREGEESPPTNIGFRLAGNPAGRFLLRQFLPRGQFAKSLRGLVVDDTIIDEALIDRYWELMRLPTNRHALPYVLAADHEPEMAAHLSEIRAPTLIIWGAQDKVVYPSAAETFNERIPNSEVRMYDGVGHIPMEEAPDRTADDIRRFVEGLSLEAGKAAALEAAH